MSPAAQPPISPFKGLIPFEASDLDAMLFFGREREREIITANLLASRLTVLYGPSGVGKTSILRAGVAHGLHAMDRQSVERGRGRELAVVAFGAWTGDPVAALREAVAAELFDDPERALASDRPLSDDLATWTEQLDLDVYLILDQAEEYAVYHSLAAVEGSFVQQFPELVTRPGLRVNCLLALREEALATLDVFKAQIPNLLANRLRLEHLDRAAGRAAIVGPIEAYNRVSPDQVEIEPDLVEAVLDQVGTGALDYGRAGRGRRREVAGAGLIEAPFLQLVMQRLWQVEQQERSGELGLVALDRLGGAQRIVEGHLERALAALTPGERDAAAGMFQYLVTPSGTKIAHEVGDLRNYAAVPQAELDVVLRQLSEERILRSVSEGQNGAGARFEIFHDVLADAVLAWRDRYEAQQELDRTRREGERRNRRLLVLVGVSLVALAAMAAVTIFALTQRSEARSQAQHARAGQLTSAALSQLDVDPQRSLQLALAAARIEHTPSGEDVMRRALLEARLRLILPSGGPVTSASFDRDQTQILTTSRDGKARLFDARSGLMLHVLPSTSPVTVAAFSPDGRYIATGSRDRAELWDARTGRRLRALRHPSLVTGLAFDHSGTRLVTTAVDRTARIWQVPSGRFVIEIPHDQPLLGAAFSPDGSLVLVRSGTAAWLYEVPSGRLVNVLRQGAAVAAAAFSPNGSFVATGGSNHKTIVWNVRTGAPAYPPLREQGRVTDVTFGPHGARLLTTTDTGSARVWNAASGALVAPTSGHLGAITHASFSPDGKWIVTSSADRTARVYGVRNGGLISVLRGHRGAVRTASFSPDGNLVVTASDDGTARVWDPGSEPQLQLLGSQQGPVVMASFSRPDGRRVVSASDDGTARVWRVSDRRQLDVLHHHGKVTSARFSPDGHAILTTSRDGTARIWRGGSSLRLRQGSPVTAGSFSRDGRLVVTAAENGTVHVWLARDGSTVWIRDHRAPVRAVAFSPNGKLVVSAGDGGNARLWNVSNGRLRHILQGQAEAVVAASFSPDGRRVLTANGYPGIPPDKVPSRDTTAVIWDASTGRRLQVLRGHRNPLTSASFSPDGKLVLTSSFDITARIWRGKSSLVLHHFGTVSDASFSPDGRWVVTAGPITAGLWSTRTGEPLLLLFRHRGGRRQHLTTAVFSPNGRQILTAGTDGDVKLYACDVCPTLGGLIPVAERRLHAPIAHLTPAQRRRYGVG